MGERRILIVIGIDGSHLLYRRGALGVGRDEDATRKASALGNEKDATIVFGLQLVDGLVNLQQVLVGEGLIDGDIVGAPREMGGGSELLPGTGATGDSVDMYVATDDACLQRRQHGELYAGGETAGVGHTVGMADIAAVNLRQAIYPLTIDD